MRLSPADIEACREISGKVAREILRDVARYSGVKSSDILGPVSAGKVVRARQIFMLACSEAGLKSVEIGRFLARDHSTVLHGIKVEKARRAQ